MKTGANKFLGVLLVVFGTGIPAAFACNGCRQPGGAMGEEPGTVLAGMAFSWNIMGMLVLVFVVVAGLSAYIAKTCREVDRRNRDQIQ